MCRGFGVFTGARGALLNIKPQTIRQQLNKTHREKMLKEVFVVLEVSEEPIVLMSQHWCTCQEMIRLYRLE